MVWSIAGNWLITAPAAFIYVKHKKWYTFYSPKKCKTLAFISQEAVCFTAIYGVSLVTNHQSRLHTKLFYTKLFTLGTEMKEYLV